MERTFVFIKPDACRRGLIGQILTRFERTGLKLVAGKLIKMTKEQASSLYEEHVGKPFYDGLVEFAVTGPTFVMVLEGKDSVKVARNLIGATNAADAAPGSIRGDFAMEIGRNVIHGTDSAEKAKTEYGIFFDDSELVDYKTVHEEWLYE